MSLDGPTLVCAGLAMLAVVGLIVLIRYSRRREAELNQHAAGSGWAVIGKAALPTALRAALRRHAVHRVWYRDTAAGPEWCVWLHWTTSSGSTTGSTTTHHNQTEFVAPVPGRGLPTVEVTRRTALGGALIPVRGVGTGDDEFDRRFLIKPGTGPAAAMVGPRLRSLMMSGAVPAWRVASNFVIVEAGSVPNRAMFDTWSGRAPFVAAQLAQG